MQRAALRDCFISSDVDVPMLVTCCHHRFMPEGDLLEKFQSSKQIVSHFRGRSEHVYLESRWVWNTFTQILEVFIVI